MKGNGFTSTTVATAAHSNSGANTLVPDNGTIYLQEFTGLTVGKKIQAFQLNVQAPTGNANTTQATNSNAGCGSQTGKVYLHKFSDLPITGEKLYSIQIKVGGAGGNVRAKIYSANGTNGNPLTLLGESNSIAVVGANPTLQNIALNSPVIIPSSGTLWAGFEMDNLATCLYTSPDGSSYGFTHTYGAGPNPAGTSVGTTVFYVGINYFLPYTQIRAKIYAANGTAGCGDICAGTLLGETNGLPVSGTGLQNFTLNSPVIIPASGKVWAGFEAYPIFGPNLFYHPPVVNTQYGNVNHVFGPGPDPCGSSCTSTFAYAWYMGLNYLSQEGQMNFKFNSNSLTTSPISPITTNSSGGFSGVTFSVPNTHNGTNTVNATDGTTIKSASFSVSPTIFLNSTNGNVGVSVAIKGNGFAPLTSFTTRYSNIVQGTTPATPATNTTGGFSNVLITIPESISGLHSVNVTDGYGTSAIVNYNVTSSITISPTSGPVGTALIGTAKGFLASNNINIKFDGVSKQNGTSNSLGSFAGVSFNVPSALAGSHTISTTDGPHTATTTFTIPGGSGSGSSTPSIILNATSGKVGKNILVNGNGFNKTSQIKFYFNNGLLGTTPAFVSTNTTGSFINAKFTIPNLPLGTYTLKVNDTLGNTATSSFTINALSIGPIGAVIDLHIITSNTTSITLGWSQPNLAGNTLSGYQINYTTPGGNPMLELTNNTLSSSTNAVIKPLFANTQYSFRLGVWAGNYFNPNGNIVTGTTPSDFTPQNFTVGRNQGAILNASNTAQVPMYFVRNDIQNTNNTNLNLIYPNSFNPTCSTFFEFAQSNKSYSNLANVPFDGNNKISTFSFNNVNNDVVDINCIDLNTHTTAKFVLTEPITGSGKLVFLQQIDNFRNGTYGTHGQFGALDFITLVAVLLSMIGLNRYDEAVGGIISVIMIGILSFFGIISILSTILSVVALVVLLLVTTTRKN